MPSFKTTLQRRRRNSAWGLSLLTHKCLIEKVYQPRARCELTSLLSEKVNDSFTGRVAAGGCPMTRAASMPTET